MSVFRHNGVPSIKIGACIEEAVDVMIDQGCFVLQVTDEKGDPVGWLNCLDILRSFISDSGVTEIGKNSVRNLMRAIVNDGCLDVGKGPFNENLWDRKKDKRAYETSGLTVGGLLSQWLMLQAFQAKAKEHELRKKAEVRLKRLSRAQQNLEMALLYLFADFRVVNQLKSIVEYQDEYDPVSGKIRVRGVIKAGGYIHVVNILRLMADLWGKGLLDLTGIHKQTLIKTAIFHDLSKIQPQLKVGEIVNPLEAFEPGKTHAFRSASVAHRLFNLDENSIYLIKYHHHAEEELPNDFPPALLPMHRLFRLLDGLSAGITRRGSKVNLKVKGSLLEVWEKSIHPSYNRHLKMDLCSGIVEVQSLNHWADSRY
ncbi:HD domain-containing protein [Desulfurispora thermophila]|uniref:HD domain-containing protein n=1 Tax=Desulfurispora thermophila TaxID=265470 RepID=UPI000381C1CC|nr:HD domain-containing protein [Desulfurispora thermophila]